MLERLSRQGGHPYFIYTNQMKEALLMEELPIPKQFTKGKKYPILHEESGYAVLRDDNNMAHAVKEWKSKFNFNIN